MSFLTPVKVPVKVYLSTDKDAPKLDRTPNCVATILKACLVTGYGDKQPAGWSLAFEDNPKGVKVLKPADSPHKPFVLKLSADTGTTLKPEIYNDTEQAQTGTPILHFSNRVWSYGLNYYRTNGRWMVVACDRAFWLFYEAGQGTLNKNGVYLYCGDTAQNTQGERAITMVHTFSWGIVYGSSEIQAVISNKTTANVRPTSYFDGITNLSANALLSPTFLRHEQEIFGLPVFMASNVKAENYQILTAQGRNFICHGHATTNASNAFVPIDHWEF